MDRDPEIDLIKKSLLGDIALLSIYSHPTFKGVVGASLAFWCLGYPRIMAPMHVFPSGKPTASITGLWLFTAR